jgi:murein DD-endopeptidase MepM/ murein hydrolase activator NlpD
MLNQLNSRSLRMKSLLIIFLGLLTASNVSAGEPVNKGGVKRDTIQAVVQYGEEILFDALEGLTDGQVGDLRDSVLKYHGANELTNYINLYLSLKSKTEVQLNEYIDSLFEAGGDVPYALINQINIYLANKPEDLEEIVPDNLFIGLTDMSVPATEFYPIWTSDNPNPYKPEIWKNDTSFSLLLANDELGDFHIPHDDVMTSKFGWRDGRMHNGVDIDLQVWDTVVAAFPGVVRMARAYGGYGRVVIIRHYNGLETTYAHLHRFKVKEGDKVDGGQLIGLGGSSGHSTGSHLHFEIRFKGVPLNPLSFISFKEQELLNDTLVLKRTKTGFIAYPRGILFHTVKRGDTLYEIAKQYGTSTYKLAEINGIRRNRYLSVGQRLRVI